MAMLTKPFCISTLCLYVMFHMPACLTVRQKMLSMWVFFLIEGNMGLRQHNNYMEYDKEI